jgi:hypothetical protein
MKPDYAEFDAALLNAIDSGQNTLAQLEANAQVRVQSQRHRLKVDRWGHLMPYARVVDRRLQALRKRGELRYTGKAWERTSKAASA